MSMGRFMVEPGPDRREGLASSLMGVGVTRASVSQSSCAEVGDCPFPHSGGCWSRPRVPEGEPSDTPTQDALTEVQGLQQRR